MTLQIYAANNSASVDWGPSVGSRVRRPGSEDLHRRQRNFFINLLSHYEKEYIVNFLA